MKHWGQHNGHRDQQGPSHIHNPLYNNNYRGQCSRMEDTKCPDYNGIISASTEAQLMMFG